MPLISYLPQKKKKEKKILQCISTNLKVQMLSDEMEKC